MPSHPKINLLLLSRQADVAEQANEPVMLAPDEVRYIVSLLAAAGDGER